MCGSRTVWSRATLWLASGWLTSVGLAGCTPDENTGPTAAGGAPGSIDARWPYWPRAMRIHPLTRIAVDRETGNLVIEARLELRDRDDRTTRAWGQFRLDLHDASDESPAGSLAQWNLDLRDLRLNRERFDDVTLTYLFRLEPPMIPENPVLRVYYLSADGTELKDTDKVRGTRTPREED